MEWLFRTIEGLQASPGALQNTELFSHEDIPRDNIFYTVNFMDPSDKEYIRGIISVKQRSQQQEQERHRIIKWDRLQSKQAL